MVLSNISLPSSGLNSKPVGLSCCLLHTGLLLGLLLNPEDGRDVSPKSRLTLNGLYSIITQMTELLITTIERTSDPMYH